MMSLSSPSARAWPVLLAEAGLIVVSILLAFALDSWWDGRQERSREEELLIALHEDLRHSRSRADSALAETDRILARNAFVIDEIHRPRAPSVPTASDRSSWTE